MAFVQAGQVRLEYFDVGYDGRTMVLVHGASSSARIWHMVQERMAEAGVRTVAIGMRGAGGSDHTPNREDYNPAAYARDLAAALNALSVKRFALVGHSLGVATAIHFMRDHAADFEVQALVLMAGGDARGRPLPTPEQMRELEETVDCPPADDEGTRRARWKPNHLGLPPDIRDDLWRDIQNNPKERVLGQRLCERPDMTAVLATLTVPTLVMSGDADGTVPLEATLRSFLSLPLEHRHLHGFHGVSHFPNAHVPDQVADVLHLFIDAHVPILESP
ncbi:MAG: alpha/beta hydrolase [Chloroflexota bacterium]